MTGISLLFACYGNPLLVDARLEGANFEGAHLEDADLRGANLTGAQNLTQDQVTKACGDTTTKLPAYLARV